jgi:hypothetical protein
MAYSVASLLCGCVYDNLYPNKMLLKIGLKHTETGLQHTENGSEAVSRSIRMNLTRILDRIRESNILIR